MYADFETMEIKYSNIKINRHSGLIERKDLFIESSNDFPTSEEEFVDVPSNNIPLKEYFARLKNKKDVNREKNTQVYSRHKAVSVCAKNYGPVDLNQKFPIFLYVGGDAARKFKEYSKR